MAITVGQGGSINAPLGNISEQGVGLNAAAGRAIILVTGLSSDIPISSAPANILLCYEDIYIENVTMLTDATGLATGTNFQLLTDDAAGLANIFVTTVASLGTSKTIDGATVASGSYQKTVIHKSKHLQISSTGAACTGTGVWYLYIQYLPLSFRGNANPLN